MHEDKEYLKFLRFRSELIELLNKYKFELSGTCYDDGSMRVEDEKSINVYILRDKYSSYEALDTDWNVLSTDYIIKMFSEKQERLLLNKNIGIFTNDKNKAQMIFDKIYDQNKDKIERYRKGEETIDLLLYDNTHYIWIRPINMSRGHRCTKAYIDKNLTLYELKDVVLPICINCSRTNIIII